MALFTDVKDVCFYRMEVRELGLTVVIDSRKCPLPSVFYKSLLMVQVRICQENNHHHQLPASTSEHILYAHNLEMKLSSRRQSRVKLQSLFTCFTHTYVSDECVCYTGAGPSCSAHYLDAC